MAKKILPLLARILLSLVFLKSAWGKMNDFGSVAAKMADAGVTFQTDLFLGGAIAFLVIGGLMLITGWNARFGAALLFIFLIPATVLFHTELINEQTTDQSTQLFKNLGLMGGLLMVMAYGAGDWVVGRKTRS